jgi:hypothetical protein
MFQCHQGFLAQLIQVEAEGVRELAEEEGIGETQN